MSNVVGELLLAIGTPRLTGCLCRGRSELFDSEDTRPRARQANEARALRLCRRCPALVECQCWFDALPKSRRPPGVVAGRVVRR